MRLFDFRRHLPVPGTTIDLEPDDVLRFPDGSNVKSKGGSRLEVISAEEAETASELFDGVDTAF